MHSLLTTLSFALSLLPAVASASAEAPSPCGLEDGVPVRQAAPDATGSIVGCATDHAGAVPGVGITATGRTGSRAAVTDPKGCYALAGLEPGAYDVVAELAGFKTVTRPAVLVRPREATRLDLLLCVAGIREHIWVLPSSYEALVRQAPAVVHVRITSTRTEQDCDDAWIHTAEVVTVIKPDDGTLPRSLQIVQLRSTAEPVPYPVAAELIIPLSSANERATPLAGPFGVFVVRGGTVTRARNWFTDRYDAMTLGAFIAALRNVVR